MYLHGIPLTKSNWEEYVKLNLANRLSVNRLFFPIAKKPLVDGALKAREFSLGLIAFTKLFKNS